MRQYLSNLIMAQELSVPYTVRDIAPNTTIDLFNEPGLIIWSGASDDLLWTSQEVNYKFRAIHDLTHLKTRLDFSPVQEIELGRIQANYYSSQCKSLLADVVYCEIAEQAKYYLRTGQFVSNQLEFTIKYLGGKNA